MNVNDIPEGEIPTDFTTHDRLDLIFMRQHKLAMKYTPIERDNGLLQTEDFPVNLHDRHGQARLKDFFWRVTEEVTEAVDARRTHAHLPTHAIEELSDTLHFLIEAYLLAEITPNDLAPSTGMDKLAAVCFDVFSEKYESLESYGYEVVHQIGLASNCLKQRPWKQNHQLTDVGTFRAHLTGAFRPLMAMFMSCGLGHEEIFRIYWLKSEVNKFRIRSNY